MKKLKTFLTLMCAIALLLCDPYIAFAETDEPETAAKTVRISTNSNEENDPDKQDLGPGERDEKSEQNKINTEDGTSERSKDTPVVRMDITEMTEVRIGSYEDWVKFAKNCSLDSWSADKYVVITDNIDFNMKEFVPVPYFAGVLEGGGNALSKAAFTGNDNYIGIISKTAPTAVIRNLNVLGVMKPEGKPFDIGGIVGDNAGMIANCKFDGFVEGYDYIGGIAGYNSATGTISQCSVTGTITGLHHVGGICGTNIGLITACHSKADINTVTKEVQTDIKDIKVEEMFTSLINKGKQENNKMSLRSSTNPVDIGGIAGHNTGEISSCINESNVGYEHVGYNVGGIAGRQSGYIHDCANQGYIQGRKDVGGIVGQAEPYIKLDLNADVIAQVSTAINKLHDSVDKTIKDTDSSSDVVSARLNVIKSFADRAIGDTGYLANSTQDYINGVAGSANEVIGRVEYAISESSKKDGPMEDIEEAGADLRDAAANLEKAVNDLDVYNYLNDGDKARYNDARKNIKEANKAYEGYYDDYMTNPAYEADRQNEFNTARQQFITDKHNEDPATWADNYDDLTDSQKAEADAEGKAAVASWAAGRAKIKYKNEKGTEYGDDIAKNTEILADLIFANIDKVVENEKKDGKATTKELKDMAQDLKDAGNGFKNILRDISNKSPVRIPQLSDEYRLHTNSLVANIQGMSDNLGFLNNEMKGSTDIMCADLEDVNDDFSSLLLLITDAMDGALDMDYSDVFQDESDDVCETSVDATIAKCMNTGEIYADINTGGIAGTMAQEYDFDLEGDVTGVKSSAKKSTYRTKCVMRDDINRGVIRGKKSYAGGVCGLHEIGTILRSDNYSKVSSESGDYVGGIAGRSYSTIRNAHEKGVLSGQSYIGGIAGVGEDMIGCVAMPSIVKGTNFCGAIAGSADESGKIEENVFVSDTLAGIDRISRDKCAYPVTYGQLMTMENIPSDYRDLKVDFIVDNKIVATLTKKSGEVITPSETPIETEVAQKGKKKKKEEAEAANSKKIILDDDQYIDWDCDEEIPVYEDMEIEGTITRYTTTLASEMEGDRGQSKFLVDGRFTNDDSVEVTALPSDNVEVEEFTIKIPDDGMLSHRIRYEIPTNSLEERIFIKTGEEWIEVEPEMYGDYQVFEASGNEVTVRIDKRDVFKLLKSVAKITVPIVTVIVLLIVIKILRSRARKKRKAAEAAKAKENEIPDLEDLDAEEEPQEEPADDKKESKEES